MSLSETVKLYKELEEDDKISFFSKIKTDSVFKDKEATIRSNEKNKLYDDITAEKNKNKILLDENETLKNTITEKENEIKTIKESGKQEVDEETKKAFDEMKSKIDTLESTLANQATEFSKTKRDLAVSKLQNKYSLSDQSLKFIQGETLEEMESSAKDLSELLGSTKQKVDEPAKNDPTDVVKDNKVDPVKDDKQSLKDGKGSDKIEQDAGNFNDPIKTDNIIVPSPTINDGGTGDKYDAKSLRNMTLKEFAKHRDEIKAERKARVVNSFAEAEKTAQIMN